MPFDSSNAMSDNGQTGVLVKWFFSGRPYSFIASLIRSVAVTRLSVVKAPLILLRVHSWAAWAIEVEMQVRSSRVPIRNVRIEIVVANISRDIVNLVSIRLIVVMNERCSMLLEIHNLGHIGFIERCRDAECKRLLSSINVNVLVMVYRLGRGLLRSWRRFKIRLRLAVFVVIVLSVVAVWCTTRRTLLLISDYRFVYHCDASITAADCHGCRQDSPRIRLWMVDFNRSEITIAVVTAADVEHSTVSDDTRIATTERHFSDA